MRLVCEWIEVDSPRVGVGLAGKFDLRVALVSLAEAELVEAAFMNSLGFAHRRRRSYRGNDHAVTWIRTMKGRRQGNWDPDLGLAILAATQYPPHTQQVIANYMGVSQQRGGAD